MSDPDWYDALPKWVRETIDQAAHFALGAAVSGLAGGVATIWLSGGWSGLIGASASALAAVIRELAQNLGDTNNRVWDSILDTLAWTAGGVVIGIIIWGCA